MDVSILFTPMPLTWMELVVLSVCVLPILWTLARLVENSKITRLQHEAEAMALVLQQREDLLVDLVPAHVAETLMVRRSTWSGEDHSSSVVRSSSRLSAATRRQRSTTFDGVTNKFKPVTLRRRSFNAISQADQSVALEPKRHSKVELASDFADTFLGTHMECMLGELQPERLISYSHMCISVLFSDIVGFTALSHQLAPHVVMEMLHNLFYKFDLVCELFNVYKVETIGDGYMAAAGLFTTEEDNSSKAEDAYAALQVAQSFHEVAATVVNPATLKRGLSLRVGIHSGPASSGIVGNIRARYCLFGDVVNIAARMETTCQENHTQVSQETHQLLMSSSGSEAVETIFDVRQVDCKGVGRMEVYTAGPSAESWKLVQELVGLRLRFDSGGPKSEGESPRRSGRHSCPAAWSAVTDHELCTETVSEARDFILRRRLSAVDMDQRTSMLGRACYTHTASGAGGSSSSSSRRRRVSTSDCEERQVSSSGEKVEVRERWPGVGPSSGGGWIPPSERWGDGEPYDHAGIRACCLRGRRRWSSLPDPDVFHADDRPLSEPQATPARAPPAADPALHTQLASEGPSMGDFRNTLLGADFSLLAAAVSRDPSSWPPCPACDLSSQSGSSRSSAEQPSPAPGDGLRIIDEEGTIVRCLRHCETRQDSEECKTNAPPLGPWVSLSTLSAAQC